MREVMNEVDKAAKGTFNGNGTLSKVFRFILIFGWVAAGYLFWILADQILTGQKLIQAEVQAICLEVGVIKEWRNSMEHQHRRIDKRLDRIEYGGKKNE